ncbi:hypothetical protein GWN26_00870, partial [Candidatus Saccharibacteria bacterium]|nr:hypothetical protein [Calditrichia bacterium]NIV97766.1 hypothetical protein [Candidatus Saccharibacteria bacterium]
TAYPPQKFACLGDHDHWSNPSRITSGLSDCGWTFLRNEHRVVKYKGSRILITGITYIYSQRLAKASLTTILEEKAPPSDLKILLVHQPSPMVIETAQEYGYDLVLAGHTHGGQVVFRPFGFSLTLSQFESIFYTGYHRYKDMPVVVTNGIGLTLAPLRYHAPAEVCKITLVKK